MTPEQKQLVRQSFASLQPASGLVGRLFYDRLFQLAPQLRPLFKGHPEEQARKLMQMLGLAVQGLDRLEDLVPLVCALGERHAAYGVSDEDYETVGAALIWALGVGLGPPFTRATREAWLALYQLPARTMQEDA